MAGNNQKKGGGRASGGAVAGAGTAAEPAKRMEFIIKFTDPATKRVRSERYNEYAPAQELGMRLKSRGFYGIRIDKEKDRLENPLG